MNPIITEMTSSKGQKAYVSGNPEVCEYGENESIAISKLLLRLQGKRMSSLSGAFWFACAMWLSWLALSWLFIFSAIEESIFSKFMWGLFLFFAIMGSAYGTKK